MIKKDKKMNKSSQKSAPLSFLFYIAPPAPPHPLRSPESKLFSQSFEKHNEAEICFGVKREEERIILDTYLGRLEQKER